MKTIHLSDDCSTPIELLSLRGITYGNSGAGKTALGRVLFEESDKAGVPNCVIDLKGDWWGLKSSKTGNSEATGFKRSTRDTYLSRMSAKMITSEPQRGMVAAANQLFE